MSTDSNSSHKILIFGVTFIILGGGMLLWTSGYLSSFRSLWPVPLIFLGALLLFLVYLKGASDIYIFPGMFLCLGSICFLILNIFQPEDFINKIWPVFMFIAGVSIIPYAVKRKKHKKHALLISGISIVSLSIIFLPFSLGFVNKSFSEVVSIWWPVLFLVLGITFLVSYIVKLSETRKGKSKNC